MKILFYKIIVTIRLILHICSVDGESAHDRHRSMGEVVRSRLQLPGCRGCNRCWSLPLLRGPGRPHRGHKASSGLALLCILYTTPAMADITANLII